jgi:hypothetical protein
MAIVVRSKLPVAKLRLCSVRHMLLTQASPSWSRWSRARDVKPSDVIFFFCLPFSAPVVPPLAIGFAIGV